MKKTFLLNDFARSLEFLAKPLALRGAWCAAQSYCAERETGGVIRNAEAFTAAMWGGLFGAGGSRRIAEALASAGLARWDRADLVIAGYDLESEQGYRTRREAGRLGGVASAETRKGKRRDDAQTENHEGLSDQDPTKPSKLRSTKPGEKRQVGRGEDPDGEAPPLDPLGLVLDFERAYEVRTCVRYESTDVERGKACDLWGRLTPRDRSSLIGEIRTYLATHFDATLAGFCEWESERLFADRGAA